MTELSPSANELQPTNNDAPAPAQHPTAKELVARAIAPIQKEFMRPPPIRNSQNVPSSTVSNKNDLNNNDNNSSTLAKETKLKRERREEKNSRTNICLEIAKTANVNSCIFLDKSGFSHDVEAFKGLDAKKKMAGEKEGNQVTVYDLNGSSKEAGGDKSDCSLKGGVDCIVDEACANDDLRPSKKARSEVDGKRSSDGVGNIVVQLDKESEKRFTESVSEAKPDETPTESEMGLKVHPGENKLIDFREKLCLTPLKICKGLGADVTCGEMEEDSNLLVQENTLKEYSSDINELIPKVGMVFESEEELYEYFKKYAYQAGFGVRKSSCKTKSGSYGEAKYYALACARGGKYVPKVSSDKMRLSAKTECMAKISVIVNSNGRCTISRVSLEHNHALSPRKSRFQRSYRKKDSHSKKKLELNDLYDNFFEAARLVNSQEKYEFFMELISNAKERLKDDSCWGDSGQASPVSAETIVENKNTVTRIKCGGKEVVKEDDSNKVLPKIATKKVLRTLCMKPRESTLQNRYFLHNHRCNDLGQILQTESRETKKKENTAITLNNAYKMPLIGLGVWCMDKTDIRDLIINSIKLGYRHFDCAADYRNEAEVGKALAEAFKTGLVKREDLFITTKLWNSDHGHVEGACKDSLKKLKLDYLDLYLVHFPVATRHTGIGTTDNALGEGGVLDIDTTVSLETTWHAMEDLVFKGLVRRIGISNYDIFLTRDCLAYSKVKPAVNQIETHPYFQREQLVKFCQKHGICVTAHTPLGGDSANSKRFGSVSCLNDPLLKVLAGKYKKTVAQIVLRWGLQRNTLVIPKSSKKLERLEENIRIFDFELTKEDMDLIGTIDRKHPDQSTSQILGC